MQTAEVDWKRLDKFKFFVIGAGCFTGLTTALFPLSVIKTRQMALEHAPRGVRGAYLTAQSVLHHDGVRGLYKGFGTVISGAIPARIVYLSTLELMKSATSSMLHRYNLGDTANAGLASFVAGGCASATAQLVVVPVDVVAQRLMLMGGGAPGGSSNSTGGSGGSGSVAVSAAGSGSSSSAVGAAAARSSSRAVRVNGLQLAKEIIAQDGVRGLYRGFGASLAMFVPNSAIWWGLYSSYQRIFWHQVDSWRGVHRRTEGEMLAVQAGAGIITGFSSAFLTNPLDVVKTRLQTRSVEPGAAKPTFVGTISQLLRSDGVKGFYRGVAPRMFSSAIWGTAMVTTYEFLKRLCQLPPEAGEAAE